MGRCIAGAETRSGTGLEAAAEASAPADDSALVTLLPQRAALWGVGQTLLVADLHLGKCETFHGAGVPVPGGIHDETLGRLGEAIRVSGAQRVLILGDLLHAPAGNTTAMIDAVAAWRQEFSLPMQLVEGNHDRRVREAAEVWNIELLGARHEEQGVLFTHAPTPEIGESVYSWCGHLHPAIKIHGGRLPVKLACFHLSPTIGVLPAFSRLTAGAGLRRGPGDRVFAIAEGRVVEV
ncbi:MAG: ligase-associated DNA damage response endonuclease PdeM [Phycisphaerales bacterium]